MRGALAALIGVAAASAFAAEPPPTAAAATPPGPLTLVIQNHRFSPAEITIPANKAVAILVINKDPLAEEFDSSALKIEKVIAGNDSGTIRLRPLAPGRYPFAGEYHSDTAKGVVIAQ